MENMKVALEAAGASFEDVISRTVYTLEPTQFEVIAHAMENVTGPLPHPTQTLIGVTGLAVPGLLIEIDAIACLD
ncbi:RidA family protein [Nitriliruptor alkaliphilus]|uniref:RidA family protein n=1 Tax=Nitriliruptor alkaliphilus TaxID=427918 RepID=UPI001FDFEE47